MECESIASLLHSVEQLIANQPPRNDWLDIWLSPLSAIVGIVLTAILSYFLGFKTQINVATIRSRQESFGKLMGYKFSLSQLYVSRFEARILSDYHERRWNLLGDVNGSLDFQETQRWMHKSENLTDLISEKNEALFSTLGTIKAVFPKSKELDELIDAIYKFKAPTVSQIPDEFNLDDLNRWKETAINQLQQIVKREIADPINNLVRYLESNKKLNTA